jgi:hypothetical protein
VLSKGVELFYVPKAHIINAWKSPGIIIDYPDRSSEPVKQRLVEHAENAIHRNKDIFLNVADTLKNIIGKSQLIAFEKKIASKLGATPQEYKIIVQQSSDPFSFSSHQDVDDFLNKNIAATEFSHTRYSYEVVFGDGDAFSGDSLTFDELKKRHFELRRLIIHMENIA